MRYSDFTELAEAEFGREYAATLVRDHVLLRFGDTPRQALARGIPPRVVWAEICADFDVPPERQFGPDKPTRPARD